MMRGFSRQPSRTLLGFLLSAAWCIASGTALAQVPVTGYVVVQPIDVCQSTGWSGNTTFSCAPFNSSDNNPNPAKTTSSTTIGFVDPTTNINITRQIWRQAGIDIVFQPFVTPTGSVFQYNDTTSTYLNINDFTCTSTSCSSGNFSKLAGGKVKGVPLSPDSTTLNMFFVNSLSGGSSVATPLYGFGLIGANGVVINSDGVFFPTGGVLPRFDTLAHETGHNLGLNHISTLCSGVVMPAPGGCNLMDTGSIRNLAATTGCTPASTVLPSPTGGELYDLDTGLCSPAAPNPIADNLTLGSNSQQSAALSSVFFNPSANIPASAGGGDVSFTVSYPTKINGKPNGPAGGYIAALILQLPLGFQFGSNLFTQTGGTAVAVSAVQLNGNNGGGNSNCLAVINKTPTVQCLEIDFAAPPATGAFTPGASISFTSDIVFKSNPSQFATMADLGCATPSPQNCLDLTYVFGSLLATTSIFGRPDKTGNSAANSQFPDDTVPAVIVDPHDFPTLNPNATFVGFNGPALQTFCMNNPSSPSCPSGATGPLVPAGAPGD